MIALATDIQQVVLSDGTGRPLVVDEGESLDLFVTFRSSAGVTIAPTTMATIVLTVERHATGVVVNSINEVDVKDAGRGTIDGNTLDVRLDGTDTGLSGTRDELHVATVKATYNDGVAIRTSIHKGMYWVRSATLPPA